jgi:hypothetical protein
MKKLEMNVECCLECPLSMCGKDGHGREGAYWYCSHIDSPDDHSLFEAKDIDDFEDYMPDWCPLPDIDIDIDIGGDREV